MHTLQLTNGQAHWLQVIIANGGLKTPLDLFAAGSFALKHLNGVSEADLPEDDKARADFMVAIRPETEIDEATRNALRTALGNVIATGQLKPNPHILGLIKTLGLVD